MIDRGAYYTDSAAVCVVVNVMERKKLTCVHTMYTYECHSYHRVPGGLVGGPRAYQDQFRGFKSHRVHARNDFFLHERN